MERKKKFVLVNGNPVDGFDLIGPFETEKEALEWAMIQGTDYPWWVTTIYPPWEIDEKVDAAHRKEIAKHEDPKDKLKKITVSYNPVVLERD